MTLLAHLLLALGLSSPWMLGWLAAASIPVWIHLWYRRRRTEHRWAATRLLIAAVTRRGRRLRISQWLLLALRAVLIGCVAVAAAGPFRQSAGVGVAAGQRTDRILVIDASWSMAYRPENDGQTRFDRAKRLATSIVQQSRQGDGFSLILMADRPRTIVRGPVFDAGAVRQEIARLRRLDGGGDVLATLAQVEAMATESARAFPHLAHREVYWLTDLGATSWKVAVPGDGNANPFRTQVARISAVARLNLIDVGQTETDNLSVTRLVPSDRLGTASAPVRLIADIENHSSHAYPDQRVELYVDGHPAKKTTVTLAPHDRQSVVFSYTFQHPGDHTAEVRLAPDRLPLDNHRYLALRLPATVNVLCVGGSPRATHYLALALNPRRPAAGPIQPREVDDSQLDEIALTPFACVIFSNVRQFTAAEAKQLKAYLDAGGSTIFFLGSAVRALPYNRALAGEGGGGVHVLPVRIRAVAPPGRYRFDPLGYHHPSIAPFRGREQAGLLTTPIRRYWRLQLPSGSPHFPRHVVTAQAATTTVPSAATSIRPLEQTHVALALRNGDPAVVEGRVGLGRSIVVAVPASLDAHDPATAEPWTALPVWPSFLPLVRELLIRAVRVKQEPLTAGVGDAIGARLPATPDPVPVRVTIRTPDDRQLSLPVQRHGDHATWSFSGTTSSGIYRARYMEPDRGEHMFAVNLLAEEGKLTRIDPRQLPHRFQVLDGWRPFDRASETPLPVRRPLDRWLLGGALVLAMLDPLLALCLKRRANASPDWTASRGKPVPRMPRATRQPDGERLLTGTIIATAPATDPIQWTLHSSWNLAPALTLLLIALLAAVVFGCYRSERPVRGGRSTWLAAVLRMAVVALLLGMLAEPSWHRRRTAPPILAIVIDHSPSMRITDCTDLGAIPSADGKASNAGRRPVGRTISRLDQIKQRLTGENGLLRAVADRYRPIVYTVSDRVDHLAGAEAAVDRRIRDLQPSGNASRLGAAFRQIVTDWRTTLPAAVILLSDGNNTDDQPLIDEAAVLARHAVPLFTVGVGNSTSPADVRIAQVIVDALAYLGDPIVFRVTIASHGLAGQTAVVRLRANDDATILATTTVKLPADDRPVAVQLVHRPTRSGRVEYHLAIAPMAREADTQNNRRTRLVRIVERSVRVLLVQAYPNYEYRYLKHVLEREPTIELRTVLQDADPEYTQLDRTALRSFPRRRDDLFSYDVVVLGDADPELLGRQALGNLRDFVEQEGGGLVLISGPRHMPLDYAETPLRQVLPIHVETAELPTGSEARTGGFFIRPTGIGLRSSSMQLGKTRRATAGIWATLPPCYWMLEAPDLKPAARVLARRSLPGHAPQSPRAGLPAIVTHYAGRGTVLFHAIDATWRWRFRVGDIYFGRYWIQALRALARNRLGTGGHRVELICDRSRYALNEPVHLRARFFDGRLAPETDDGVVVLVRSAASPPRRQRLRRIEGNRRLFEGELSGLSAGTYRASIAIPTFPADPPSADFTVVATPREFQSTAMAAADLATASAMTGGRSYAAATSGRMARDLPRGTRRLVEALPAVPIWNRPWMLSAFLLLLTAEWMVRRRIGLW